MYNLQEAYLGVYYDLDEAEKVFPYGKVGDKLRSLHSKRQEAKTPEEENRIANRQKKINKEYNVPMEQLDLYDLIFDYLLDEGYADTEESATVIMANMSEEWVDSIADAYVPYEGKPQENVRRKQDKLADRWGQPGVENRFHKMGKVDSEMSNPDKAKYRKAINRLRDTAVQRRGSNP